RNAEVFKPTLDEVNHLIASRLRLDKFWVFFDMFKQAICVLAHLEEVTFFFQKLYGTTAVGTVSILQLILYPECLTRSTVPTLIGTLVNIAFIVYFLEDILHSFMVPLFG